MSRRIKMDNHDALGYRSREEMLQWNNEQLKDIVLSAISMGRYDGTSNAAFVARQFILDSGDQLLRWEIDERCCRQPKQLDYESDGKDIAYQRWESITEDPKSWLYELTSSGTEELAQLDANLKAIAYRSMQDAKRRHGMVEQDRKNGYTDQLKNKSTFPSKSSVQQQTRRFSSEHLHDAQVIEDFRHIARLSENNQAMESQLISMLRQFCPKSKVTASTIQKSLRPKLKKYLTRIDMHQQDE